jgi:hypothetical protein
MVTMHRPVNVNWKVAVYGDEGAHAVAHYHVEGPDFRCSIDIVTSELIIGDAPKKILADAREWAEANRDLLLEKYKELNP